MYSLNICVTVFASTRSVHHQHIWSERYSNFGSIKLLIRSVIPCSVLITRRQIFEQASSCIEYLRLINAVSGYRSSTPTCHAPPCSTSQDSCCCIDALMFNSIVSRSIACDVNSRLGFDVLEKAISVSVIEGAFACNNAFQHTNNRQVTSAREGYRLSSLRSDCTTHEAYIPAVFPEPLKLQSCRRLQAYIDLLYFCNLIHLRDVYSEINQYHSHMRKWFVVC